MARSSRHPPIRSELMGLLTYARMCPLDDTPRLIVADWLEENGDQADRDRATFIRLQCEQSRYDAVGRRRRELSAAENQLLEKHQKSWLGGLMALQSSKARFTRGLVDLFVEAPNLFKQGMNAVLHSEAVGWIDELHLSKTSLYYLEKFLKMPLAGLIGGLVIGNESLPAAACQSIAHCELLQRLHTLDLNYNPIGNEGAVALSQSPDLGNLQHLDLWICGIEAEGARALASMRCEPQPYWINLGGNGIGEEGIRALASSSLLEKVRRFLIWGNSIRDTGLTHLVRGPYLQQIEELYLNENNLGMKAARVLATWPPLQNLRTLSIWGNLLRPRGGAILGSAPMPQMRMLLLSSTRIGDEGLRALANNPTLGKLHSLDVSNTRSTDEGIRCLLDSPFLKQLKNLNISGNTVSAALQAECESRFEMTVRDEVP
ncbi:MAG: TIGR02996 domain-containing protein [Gemmataceae bacterium]